VGVSLREVIVSSPSNLENLFFLAEFVPLIIEKVLVTFDSLDKEIRIIGVESGRSPGIATAATITEHRYADNSASHDEKFVIIGLIALL
jgi:hypothetical protein